MTNLTPTIVVDESKRQLIAETTPDGTCGVYKAPAVYNGRDSDDWNVYLETNGDPVIAPHADYPDEFAAWLADAGLSRYEFEAQLGTPWDAWCS